MGSKTTKQERPLSEGWSDEYRSTLNLKQYEFVCTTCARKSKTIDACSFCNSCKDYLCVKCLEWHFKYKAGHVDSLVGLNGMRQLGIQKPPMMPTEKCSVHNGEGWNMFCQKDGVAGCQWCMEEEHRLCESVIPRSSLQIDAANRQKKQSPRITDNKLPSNFRLSCLE